MNDRPRKIRPLKTIFVSDNGITEPMNIKDRNIKPKEQQRLFLLPQPLDNWYSVKLKDGFYER